MLPLLLAACTAAPSKPGGGGSAAPGDSGARDTGTADSADSGGTDSAATECARASRRVDLPLDGARLSPYNVRLAPDLDGKGLPDVVVPFGSDAARRLAVYRGETLVDPSPSALVVPALLSSQATSAFGAAGDLDGDGFSELAIGESAPVDRGDPNGAHTVVVRWWSAAAEAELARLERVDARGESTWNVAPSALPDLDGDGVPEVMAGLTPSRIFSGAALRGAVTDAQALLTILADQPGAHDILPDADGDGRDDLLLSSDAGAVHLLSSTAARAGGTLERAALPVVVEGGARWTLLSALLLVDTDADGAPELFSGWDDRVAAWRGTDVREAAAGRRGPLGPDDAFLVLEQADTYFGAHLAPFTDVECLPGVAISAHFGGRVYLASNAALNAADPVAALSMYVEGAGWTGYALGGGHDVDADGRLDLVVGDALSQHGGVDTVTLLVGP